MSACLPVRMPVCLYICLSLCLSVCLFVFLSLCLSVCLSVRLSICISVLCMYVCLSICMSFCLSVCLPTCIYIYLSLCRYVCLFAFLYVCLSFFLAVCLPVCPFGLFVCLAIRLSVCTFSPSGQTTGLEQERGWESSLSAYLSVSRYLYLLSIWPDDRIGAGEGLQVDILQGVQVIQGLHKYNFRRSGGIRDYKYKFKDFLVGLSLLRILVVTKHLYSYCTLYSHIETAQERP
jgi:hypothetical protein